MVKFPHYVHSVHDAHLIFHHLKICHNFQFVVACVCVFIYVFDRKKIPLIWIVLMWLTDNDRTKKMNKRWTIKMLVKWWFNNAILKTTEREREKLSPYTEWFYLGVNVTKLATNEIFLFASHINCIKSIHYLSIIFLNLPEMWMLKYQLLFSYTNLLLWANKFLTIVGGLHLIDFSW